jgi:hypothetical protein
MSKYLGILLLSALVALTVGSAWHHGRMTHRWIVPDEMRAAGQRMDAFPAQFGDWKLSLNQELAEGIVKEFQCESYYSRSYVNQVTGEEVNVLLFLGPPGPLVRHPPEICYSGRNILIGEPEKIDLQTSDGCKHQLKLLHYSSSGAIRPRFSVFTGYNFGTGWCVPEIPRVALGGEPVLYKIQVLSTEPDEQRGVPPATKAFCEEFFPLFQRLVIANPPAAA